MLQDIQFIIAGGTIDKEYCIIKQENKSRAKSCVVEYIRNFVRPDVTVHEKTITLLDSRDFTDATRESIHKVILESKSNNIIITHGTDTMAQTGQFLKSKKIVGKKIILVGAFYPLQGFVPTDAPFNLGFAIGTLRNIKYGVYIAMNMSLLDPNTAKKNQATGKFETSQELPCTKSRSKLYW
jgi:L-asparaginase